MKSIKAEASKLIKSHLEELSSSAKALGGVLISGVDGAVVVFGAKNSQKKEIFRTSFVSDNVNTLLDAQIEVQDLLEDEGIEAISEFDFNIAINEH